MLNWYPIFKLRLTLSHLALIITTSKINFRNLNTVKLLCSAAYPNTVQILLLYFLFFRKFSSFPT